MFLPQFHHVTNRKYFWFSYFLMVQYRRLGWQNLLYIYSMYVLNQANYPLCFHSISCCIYLYSKFFLLSGLGYPQDSEDRAFKRTWCTSLMKLTILVVFCPLLVDLDTQSLFSFHFWEAKELFEQQVFLVYLNSIFICAFSELLSLSLSYIFTHFSFCTPLVAYSHWCIFFAFLY